MENTSKLIMTRQDFEKLSSLLRRIDTDTGLLLEQELDRAMVVSEEELPKDVVTMNSTVKFIDLDTGKESVVTLVYPQDANIEENKISVLAPVGGALIGLKVGQTIDWPMPNGKEKRLKVTSVIDQPEAFKESTRQLG